MKNYILKSIIEECKDGKIFSVKFIKKDGSIRVMNCRLNTTKGKNGKGMNYNPIEKSLLPVYDMTNKGYRMVNIRTILSLTIKGNHYTFNQ